MRSAAWRFHLAASVVGLTLTMSGSVFPADFDGSKMLICATVDVMDCVSGENCAKGRPGDMGAPAFLRIDFAKKTIGAKVTTPIVSIDTTEEQILLKGNEQGYGWTFALDQDAGRFAATLVNREGVFVLFRIVYTAVD